MEKTDNILLLEPVPQIVVAGVWDGTDLDSVRRVAGEWFRGTVEGAPEVQGVDTRHVLEPGWSAQRGPDGRLTITSRAARERNWRPLSTRSGERAKGLEEAVSMLMHLRAQMPGAASQELVDAFAAWVAVTVEAA